MEEIWRIHCLEGTIPKDIFILLEFRNQNQDINTIVKAHENNMNIEFGWCEKENNKN